VKALDVFYPWVTPYVQSCPDPQIKQAIRDACIDFCTQTSLVQTVESQNVIAGEPQYDISPPVNHSLIRVIEVMLNERPLEAVQIDQVKHGAAMRAGEDTVVAAVVGTPNRYYQVRPTDDTIFLWPVPDLSSTSTLAIRATFTPTRAASQVEDVLFDDWAPEIGYGALARLLMIPGQAWTNPDMGSYFSKQYGKAVASATAFSRKGKVSDHARVQPVRFA
jgi:hypothetical protein